MMIVHVGHASDKDSSHGEHLIQRTVEIERLPQHLSVDLGNLQINTRSEIVLSIKNTTGKELEIFDIESGCSCVIAKTK